MSDAVRVDPPKPSWWENSSIKRAIDVASGRVPTASQVPETPQYGINYLTSQLGGLEEGFLRGAFNAGDAVTRFLSGRPGAPVGRGFGDLMYDPIAAQSALGKGPLPTQPERAPYTGQMDFPQPGSPFYIPGAEQAEKDRIAELAAQRAAEEAAANQPAPTDWLAEAIAYQNQFAPDYSGIAQGWMDEGDLVNQRLQAMYDQIASRAGENVERIGDIYGGATAGIGEAYDRSMGSVADAYASAEQQAAEQRARLGIEAAAPLTSEAAARSQAESQALLGAGRASGVSAAERYGASSGDFASQMAQVAQQEGAQYQTGVADALRRQLMNLEMQQQQDAYQRAMQAPGLANQLFQASQLGQPEGLTFEQQLALDRFAFEQAEAAEEIASRLPQAQAARYRELFEAYGNDSERALEQLQFELANNLIG